VPWSLEQRDGKYCVVKQGESSPVPGGCHPDRASAIKHQRALYANESRMASMYDELDAQPVEVPQLIAPEPQPVVASALSPFAAELVGMLLKDDREKSLVASMVDSQAQARQEAAEDRRALVAALQTLGSPVVNVPASEVSVHVPAAEVSVNVPPAEVNFTVSPAEVNVHVPPAAVNVTVEAPAPVQKTVTLERDPLTREVIKAEVTET
jgi:hypothetical protein